jgi:Rho-binding antiterminator
MVSKEYIPVACGFHDELESACVKKLLNTIIYFDKNAQITVSDFIVDIKVKKKEEFVVLKEKGEIRLDRIIRFNGLDPKKFNCEV